MMRINDIVTELELDVLDRPGLEILQQLLFDGFGNGVLLVLECRPRPTANGYVPALTQVCR
jgi:hypothetical protein